ncbi:MAG TPA: uracil-DNA glycosylase family protein [Pseudomonadales bacterium]
MPKSELALIDLLDAVSECRLCAPHLPHGPRPVLQAAASARLLIIGQAPGAKVHASGIPWDDKSGERLRHWLGVDPDVFYDPARVAIMPMGFCYPGKGVSGDLPPRAECAAQWHGQVLAGLPNVRLTLLIGHHAQRHYLAGYAGTLTDTVLAWRQHLPRFFVLPHPSPRNQAWCMHHPWFEADVVPELRRRVKACLQARPLQRRKP